MRARQAAPGDAHEALALGELAEAWAAAYRVRFEDGMYRAAYRYDDGTDLEADTLAGLESAIRAHWSRAWNPCGGGSR